MTVMKKSYFQALLSLLQHPWGHGIEALGTQHVFTMVGASWGQIIIICDLPNLASDAQVNGRSKILLMICLMAMKKGCKIGYGSLNNHIT